MAGLDLTPSDLPLESTTVPLLLRLTVDHDASSADAHGGTTCYWRKRCWITKSPFGKDWSQRSVSVQGSSHGTMNLPPRDGDIYMAAMASDLCEPIRLDYSDAYDNLFKDVDIFNKGFIEGGVSMEVMGRSGLPKKDGRRLGAGRRTPSLESIEQLEENLSIKEQEDKHRGQTREEEYKEMTAAHKADMEADKEKERQQLYNEKSLYDKGQQKIIPQETTPWK
ncbi:hypothetical protein MMC22_010464 [Lobaria immixta]|nr:hypothetical protein [Lobaria immixta]